MVIRMMVMMFGVCPSLLLLRCLETKARRMAMIMVVMTFVLRASCFCCAASRLKLGEWWMVFGVCTSLFFCLCVLEIRDSIEGRD